MSVHGVESPETPFFFSSQTYRALNVRADKVKKINESQYVCLGRGLLGLSLH